MTIDNPPYYNPVVSAGNTYSVDRMQIKLSITKNKSDVLRGDITLLKQLIQGIEISDMDTRRYHYLYSCSKKYYDENGSHYATLNLKTLKNDCESDDCCNIVINPNKFFNSKQCMQDLELLIQLSSLYFIEQLDIAIDIPIKKALTHLKKDRRAKLDFYTSKDQFTEYLGKNRNTIGHVKLYNKQAECSLPNDLTRLEITVGNPLSDSWRDSVIKRLPTVIMQIPEYKETNLSVKLNDTERVLILLLHNHPDKVDFGINLVIK